MLITLDIYQELSLVYQKFAREGLGVVSRSKGAGVGWRGLTLQTATKSSEFFPEIAVQPVHKVSMHPGGYVLTAQFKSST